MIRFQIIQQVSPPGAARPFRIVELIQTMDGPRSRLGMASFRTLEEAQAEVDAMTKAAT